MSLYISKGRFRPMSRMAVKQSIIIEGNRYQDGEFVEVILPGEYRLKYPWMRLDDLIEIPYEFDGQSLSAGSISDELHDRLSERYG